MSTSFVDAKEPSKQDKDEREKQELKINFGLFFYDKNNSEVESGLAQYYMANSKDASNEKTYGLTIPYNETGEGVLNALSHVLWILEGYAHLKGNIVLSFDIFGVQNGFLAGFLFCYLFDTSCVSGIQTVLDLPSPNAIQKAKEIKSYSKQLLLHSFTFLYKSYCIETVDNTQTSANIIPETKKNVSSNTNIKNRSTLLYGEITEEQFYGTTLSNNGPSISADNRNILTRTFDKLRTNYIILDNNVLDFVSKKVETIDNAAMVLALCPTGWSQLASGILGYISVIGDFSCSVISFDLAIIGPQNEKEKNITAAKGYAKQGAIGVIPWGKIIGKTFKQGFKFKMELDAKEIKSIKNEASNIQGKPSKEQAEHIYNLRQKKGDLREQYNILYKLINDKIDETIEYCVNAAASLKDICNFHYPLAK